jgi:hypothetical protein
MPVQSALKFAERMEITARILCILLALAALGISIAMGALPRDYKMDLGSSDDFNGETAPGPVIIVVCRSYLMSIFRFVLIAISRL